MGSIDKVSNTGTTTSTSTSSSSVNIEEKDKIKKQIYEFFDYKDVNAWPSKDLMDKYLYAAENADYNTYDGEKKSDGFLSKKEFDIFKGYLSEADKKLFPDNTMTKQEKEIYRNDHIQPDTIEDSPEFTDKDKKKRNRLCNTCTIGAGVASAGAIGSVIAGIAAEKAATAGTLAIAKGVALGSALSISAFAIGIGIVLVAGTAMYIHKKGVEKKVAEAQSREQAQQ